MNLLTIAASTSCMSNPLGFSIDSNTADFVISLNAIRFTDLKSDRISLNRHAMNSPSRSGSVAMYISSTPELTDFFTILEMTCSAFSVQPHGGLGNWPTFEAHRAFELSFEPLDGRSCTCPLHASTIHPLPRYFLIVFALAPDSRITNFNQSPRIFGRYRPCINMSKEITLQRARAGTRA